MRGAVLYEPGAPLVIEEIEVEEPHEHEVLVRMVAAGICHSDLAIARGMQAAALPSVLGHEGAGVVERVGPGVTTVAPGDHVVLLWRAGCGHCYYCNRRQPAVCEMGVRGRVSGRMPDGTTRYRVRGNAVHHFNAVSTLAEYSVVPDVSLLPIDPDVPLAEAAVVGCAVLTGVGAVFNAAQLSPGDRAAVVGCGGVGLNVIQGAVVAGAEAVIAIDVADFKLELAQTFGATHRIDARSTDPVARVYELTDGIGVDYAFDAAGRISTLEQAVRMTRRGGTTVAIGMPPMGETIAIEPLPFIVANKTIRGSIYGSSDFARDVPRILGFVRQSRLKLTELVTGRFTLEQVNDALERLESDEGNVARSVILLDDRNPPDHEQAPSRG
jgi:S-(hydroxymethyl)glutathione dehydrogenase/alcohol dehydrogenase